jgi:hypothetical protein
MQKSYNAHSAAERGKEIYARKVQPFVDTADNFGKVAAIDLISETFVVGDDILEAGDTLRECVEEPVIWYERIGHRALHRIGGKSVGIP